MSTYRSSVGPIPDDHFENDAGPDPEKTAKLGGSFATDYQAKLQARLAQSKVKPQPAEQKPEPDQS